MKNIYLCMIKTEVRILKTLFLKKTYMNDNIFIDNIKVYNYKKILVKFMKTVVKDFNIGNIGQSKIEAYFESSKHSKFFLVCH